MPESKSRKKAAYTPPPTKASAPAPLPRWFLPVALGLMILGLVWLVVTYLSKGAAYPVPGIGQWNLGIGFAIIIVGFGMFSRWR
ncbi:MAG: cell division protein CrgA [Cellulomonas iranensis]|uniref:cell division protein CrgA n=1 Tax=Cellulomonas iranensis TaxID=76862 RepID=UPI001B1BE18F|nr:cell division protein CrgA [Cellulomonas iranensis]MBO9568042.1 cell division protein CrgA [Cellulomonas iranensis]